MMVFGASVSICGTATDISAFARLREIAGITALGGDTTGAWRDGGLAQSQAA